MFSSISKLAFTPSLLNDVLNPQTANTPTPTQAQFETQIDNIANTKTERVKQPDGTWALVRSKLPLSAEDQAYMDTLEALRTSSVNHIKDLTENFDPANYPELAQYLKDYETSANMAIDRAAGRTSNQEEKALARFGQADSTAAANARVGRAATVMDQRATLGRDMSTITENARGNELNRQLGLYNLATGGITGQQSIQLGSVPGLISTGLSQQASNQAYNNSVAAIGGSNNAATLAGQQAGFSNLVGLTSLAAAPFTGGTSLMLPSLYGAASKTGYAKYGAA
ncbi:hypothetical protein Rleg2_1151 [Rhizobium leguminosarum bv. trifolii WSM2304]|uniref:Tail fiber domain-containing protein n=1 Tax=Rhizobium leguminosarum bv. trifolii (strain WSM2304) TaxID=395492 RepID=A0ABF7QK78_RHILW|nr:hypothetical protein [Rhizobium leguminosarum]ACI54445.1 hypothetical protein Rleg2_1151 [Rhizobium leguminosarum bv. trifolii WSM2304]